MTTFIAAGSGKNDYYTSAHIKSKELEFNEKAKAKVNGCGVEVAGLTGNAYFFELGTSFKVQGNENWLFNLTASGYTGVRRGLYGSAFCSLSF